MFDIPMNTKSALSLSDMASGQAAPAAPQMPMGQPSFGTPQMPMGQPQMGQPQGFGAPAAQDFGAAQNFGAPQGFGAQMPQQPMGQPTGQPQGFGAPVQQPMGVPQQPMGQPQGFGAPAPQQMQAPVQQPMQAPVPKQRPAGNGVILKKGQKASLTQMNPNLDLIEVGLGWDLGPNGQAYDLDVEAFLLNQAGKVVGDDWFVFYNQPTSPDGSVRLVADSTTGAGAGDDEIIQVKLSQVHASVQKIMFIVTINEAQERGYNFSNVQNAYVRIVDKATNQELLKFNLTDYYDTVCSMMVGEVYRHNGEWKFNSVGNGVAEGLEGLCVRYGVSVAG